MYPPKSSVQPNRPPAAVCPGGLLGYILQVSLYTSGRPAEQKFEGAWPRFLHRFHQKIYLGSAHTWGSFFVNTIAKVLLQVR